MAYVKSLIMDGNYPENLGKELKKLSWSKGAEGYSKNEMVLSLVEQVLTPPEKTVILCRYRDRKTFASIAEENGKDPAFWRRTMEGALRNMVRCGDRWLEDSRNRAKTPLTVFNMSYAVLSCMYRAKCVFWEDTQDLEEEAFRGIKSFGTSGQSEFLSKIHAAGLRMKWES